jgi:hypothetical protein
MHQNLRIIVTLYIVRVNLKSRKFKSCTGVWRKVKKLESSMNWWEGGMNRCKADEAGTPEFYRIGAYYAPVHACRFEVGVIFLYTWTDLCIDK